MTNAELAILSLVAEQPRYGYEIEQTIEMRGMREWTEIGFSSIYYLLAKLEKAGLIEGELQQVEGKGPARKVYQITPSGREAHAEGAYEALSTPRGGSVPILLGLSNFPSLDSVQAADSLQSYRQQLTEQQQHLIERIETQPDAPFFVRAMFDYSLTLILAELMWLDAFIQDLEAGENVES